MRVPTIVLFVAAGCGDTGQEEVRYPILGAGTAPGAFAAGDWEVTLDVALVGVGPIYFCANRGASTDLCPSAVEEFADSATIDGLDDAPQPLGDVTGVTGTLRSAAYDHAITWNAREPDPTPTDGAPSGHSAHFEGRATRGADAFDFVYDVDVLPALQGSLAVNGADVDAEIAGGRTDLLVTLDPAAWWSRADMGELFAAVGDPEFDPADSRALNAVLIAMVSNEPMQFEWRSP